MHRFGTDRNRSDDRQRENHRQDDGSSAPELDHERRAAHVPPGTYFDAVAEAIEAAGIALGDWYRDEDRAAVYEIDPSDVDRGPLTAIAPRGLFVGWVRPELGSLAGLEVAGGWFWVPFSGNRYSQLPEARPLAGLACLAEPADVAAAVRGIVLGGEASRDRSSGPRTWPSPRQTALST
jgi:hypothetical protein